MRTGLQRPTGAAIRAATVRRAASTHAISNPTLANIEKRWEGMPLQEQADLWMSLRDRMKGNWKELTAQEQKAGACFFTSLFLSLWRCSEIPREVLIITNQASRAVNWGFEIFLRAGQGSDSACGPWCHGGTS